MAIISVPITDETKGQMHSFISQGIESNYADIMRKAVQKYLEDLAVQSVLNAKEEPSLQGDIDELAKKL